MSTRTAWSFCEHAQVVFAFWWYRPNVYTAVVGSSSKHERVN